MSNRLFPDAPEDLGALGNEQLTDLLASFQDVSRRLRAGEINLADHFGDGVSQEDASAEAMSQWREAATQVAAIRAELASREEAVEAFAEEADQLHAAFEDDSDTAEVVAEADSTEALAAEDDSDDEDDEDDAEAASDEPSGEAAEETEEALVASTPTPRRVLYPAVPRSHRAEASEKGRTALVAASGLQGVRGGSELDAMGFARALQEVARRLGPVHHHRDGGRERTLVASASMSWPEDRVLKANDPVGNTEKIKALGSPYFGQESMEVLLASGGICAPPTPFYDIPNLSTTARPVRDALPSFMADRGGVSVPSVSTLADATGAITVIEASDDALGGTFATKSCLDMDCAEWTDVFVGAIAHCRQYGNLNARTWPEGIAHENANTMAAWARTAEGRLLDRIDALSVDVTRTAVYGASSTLLYALQLSRVGIISRLRMDPRTRFNVILPFWLAELVSLDLVNSQYGRFDTPPEQVGALLSRFGFNVTWHLDEGIAEGADAEVFETQTDGAAQVDWPGTIAVARLHPAGHFLHLDNGSMELGLVRDSTLNETNDHEVFGESFENVARIGPEEAGHRIEITICPDGTVAAPDTDAFACSAS